MKKRKINKRLVLNKETIINLKNMEQNGLKGGTSTPVPACSLGCSEVEHRCGEWSETNIIQDCEPCDL